MSPPVDSLMPPQINFLSPSPSFGRLALSLPANLCGNQAAFPSEPVVLSAPLHHSPGKYIIYEAVTTFVVSSQTFCVLFLKFLPYTAK